MAAADLYIADLHDGIIRVELPVAAFKRLGDPVDGIHDIQAADQVIPLFWKDYPNFRFAAIMAGGFVLLLAVGIPLIISWTREQKKAAETGQKVKAKDVLENTFLTVKQK